MPFLQEAIAAVSVAHRYLYGIHSLGWGVAVGIEGPIMIEAKASSVIFGEKFFSSIASRLG